MGLVGNGSPLRVHFAPLGAEVVESMMDALVEGVAPGRHPARVAKAMRDDDGVAHRRAIATSRTELMRVHRETILAAYRQSQVVEGYYRLASKSSRTCLACLLMDGEFFALDVPFAEHVNGRYVPVPALSGVAPSWTLGRDWFLGASWCSATLDDG